MNSTRRPRRARPRGRRPAGGPSTRDSIVASARALFAERGAARVSLREVAAHAGVDAALIHHFFGTKEGLLEAVLELPVPPEALAAVLRGPLETAGERLAQFYLGHVFRVGGHAISALLRAAATDEAGARALRALIEGTMVPAVAGALGDDAGAPVRAELLGALVVGLFVVRHQVRLEPLASMPDAELARLVAPIAQYALTGAGPTPRVTASERS